MLLEREVEALAGEGNDGRALAFAGDLREKLTMTNLVAATIDAYERIDVLVNAGRLLVASDPLDPEADRLEASLAAERHRQPPAQPDRGAADDRAGRRPRRRSRPTGRSST